MADDNTLYPGHPISDEIEKHITKSAVFIAVVSAEYSKSYYCNTELKEAETTGKPIILIFKEHVDVAAMGITLRTIFMNKVRAKIVLENGEYKMIPDWERLCKAIIGLIEPKNYVKIDGLSKNCLGYFCLQLSLRPATYTQGQK